METSVIRRVAVLERPDDVRSVGELTCVLDHDLAFDRAMLERSTSTALEGVDVDLLVVMAAVAFADRRVKRRCGQEWARDLSLAVPVYELVQWQRVSADLERLLCLLTGDVWHLEFRRRGGKSDLRQLFIPGLPPQFSGATVIPYSGGLDSFAAVARHHWKNTSQKLLLVHARNGARRRGPFLLERDSRAPFLALPFKVSGGEHAEQTYRTRTFVYFCLAALSWRRNDASTITIGESGTGCFGPSLVPVGIEPPVVGCHPVFIAGLAGFLQLLWGCRPRFELPNLWRTKGEVLEKLAAYDQLAGWERTCSCSRNVARQHGSSASHCGLCTGCIFRRQAVLAAKLSEPSEAYYADVLLDDALPPDAQRSDREVGIYAAVNLDELAQVARVISSHRGHIHEVATALDLPYSAVADRTLRLFTQHAKEWRGFVESLPPKSWLRPVVDHGQGTN